MKTRALSFLLAASGLLIGLNAFANNTAGIRFSRNVPKQQIDLMNKDLSLLRGLLTESDPALIKLFNMDISGANYEAWLAQRSRIVVDENLQPNQSNIRILNQRYTYPNPQMPNLEIGKAPTTGGEVKIMMSNLGGGLYLAGKEMRALLGLDIPGIGVVTINSPRVGIFQIGEGHFMPLLRRQNSADNQSFANSLSRLSTFFHEARHSDGNGKSLIFAHAICPEGTVYAGYNACDLSSNGPYAIGAGFLKSVANNCEAQGCSEAEKEALRNEYTDSYSRIVVREADARLTDELNDTLRRTCELLRSLNTPPSDMTMCNDIPNPSGEAPTQAKQAPEWDATPEIGPAK